MEVVNTFKSPLSCDDCEFSTEKSEYTARHVALVHFKLESLLQNSELVAEKIAEYESTNKNVPKRTVHNNSPLMPERKSLRTFKPTTRFVSEEQPTLKCEQSNTSQKRKGENLSNGFGNGSPIPPAKKVGKFENESPIHKDSGIRINPLTQLLKQEIKDEEVSADISMSSFKEEGYDDELNENEDAEDYEIDDLDEDEDEGTSHIVEIVPMKEEHSEEYTYTENTEHILEEETPASSSLLKRTLMKGSSPSPSKELSPLNGSSEISTQIKQPASLNLKRRLSSEDCRDSTSTGNSIPNVQFTAISKSELQSAAVIKQLPPSISLTPALPKSNNTPDLNSVKQTTSDEDGKPSNFASSSSSIIPQIIAEANDSWAQSLMTKRARSGSASLLSSPSLEITKSGSVSFTPVTSTPKMASSSVTLTPSQSSKQPVSAGIAKLIKLGSQKHIAPKKSGSVTLTPKGGSPAVSAQISRGSSVSSSWNGKEVKGSVTLTPAGSNKPSFGTSPNTGSMSLTPAEPKDRTSNDRIAGNGSLVKIKRATQAKWQLKGPPGVSVTPVTSKSNSSPRTDTSPYASSSNNQVTSNIYRINQPREMMNQEHDRTDEEFENQQEEPSQSSMNMDSYEMAQCDTEREHGDTTEDDDDMVHRMLLEPQVILDTSHNDQVSRTNAEFI